MAWARKPLGVHRNWRFISSIGMPFFGSHAVNVLNNNTILTAHPVSCKTSYQEFNELLLKKKNKQTTAS